MNYSNFESLIINLIYIYIKVTFHISHLFLLVKIVNFDVSFLLLSLVLINCVPVEFVTNFFMNNNWPCHFDKSVDNLSLSILWSGRVGSDFIKEFISWMYEIL